MVELKVKTREEILKDGIEFAGDVCFSGENGQQVYNKEMEDGGQPITGLIYEKDNNGNILYYAYYEDGVKNGDYVSFYESGKIKEMSIMKAGSKWGESVVLYENERIKCMEECKYGIILKYKEFDADGILIKEKKEPNDIEKGLLEKFQSAYEKA
uniref:toxin-antitoxin system YwqK family antitoxin n=1 Tax=Enterocloster clostridioformis TaxID=1531 RepID=UPI002A810167|nr:hypothetical protein [Enterocloster clostridioformis]